ncbi:MAG: hypothetical protein GY696_30730 [Gammaproteobacteria bacterium]|nr:hypothetical protein [Gammaproteobacteria bacterium]
MEVIEERRGLDPALTHRVRRRHRKMQSISETYGAFEVIYMIANNLVCVLNIPTERWMGHERKTRYTLQVVFQDRRQEVIHRKMITTGLSHHGWPTHIADGHSCYAKHDWSWKLGAFKITMENQRLCVCCDGNLKEYIPDPANLGSYKDHTPAIQIYRLQPIPTGAHRT